jgi:hypothetical protein
LSTIDIIPTIHDQSRRFDCTHGKGAFVRLRSMLEDPGFAYQHIGNKFGLTRQYIAQLANELGINGRQRQRERTLRCEPRVIKVEYPVGSFRLIV